MFWPLTPAIVAAAIAAPNAAAIVERGRDAVDDLAYERALSLLLPVTSDASVPAPLRAEAWMLVAQAHFGIAAPGADERVRTALDNAFRLDRDVDLHRREDVSPRLVQLVDSLRPPAPRAPRSIDDIDAGAGPRDGAGRDGGGRDDDVRDQGRAPPPSPGATWFVVAGVGAGVAVVSAAVATGVELWLGAVPPGTAAEDVRAAQRVGASAVVGVGVGVVGAVAAGVAGAVAADE